MWARIDKTTEKDR